MKRRKFLKNTTAIVATCSLFPGLVINSCTNKSLNNIGVQLFSLPKLLEKDFSVIIPPWCLWLFRAYGWRTYAPPYILIEH